MKRPNIVLVITDDMSYGDMACTGNDVIATPNLDSFYADSVRLTDFHVGPTCSPTRAGLMTGHFANSTGVWHTIGGRSLMRTNEWTLPQALRDSGFATAMFGKWHLGDSTPYRPHERGFDTAIYHGGGAIGNTPDGWGNDYFDDLYFVNGEEKRFKGYCTDVWFDEGIKWIRERAAMDAPFFCYLPTNAPHGPLNVEPRYSDPYLDKTPSARRAKFFGMITNIDENFGRLRSTLQDLDIEDDTILIFMTDNGTATGCDLDSEEYVISGVNGGLRGKKNSEYEGGHRVPFFIRYPGHATAPIAGGCDIDALCANVDLMPTLLELAGADVPHERSFHGKSLRSWFVDPSAAQSTSWHERILVTDSQRLAYPVKWRKSAAMMNRWRLVNGEELYDVVADREQRHNIADQHPERVSQLRQGYERWWAMLKPQFDLLCPIDIGGKDPTTVLTAHDIRNDNNGECETAFLQGHVRQAKAVQGYWEVNVVSSGEYLIELRRWPRGTSHAICSGIDGDDVEWRSDILGGESKQYTGGVPVRLHTARIRIGACEAEADLVPDQREVVFRLKLERGVYRLESHLYGDDGLCMAPYYIYVDPV